MYRKWSYTIKRLLKNKKMEVGGLTCIDSLRTAHGSLFCGNSFARFATEKQVNNRSFAAYTDRVIQAYQANGAALEEYGQVFTDAFYKTENGHLLSDAMKPFYGLLFHLIWNVQQQRLAVKLDKLLLVA